MQTLTIQRGVNNPEARQFILQTINSKNILRISIEPTIVENAINVIRDNYETCVNILNDLDTNISIELNDEPNSIIVLFE